MTRIFVERCSLIDPPGWVDAGRLNQKCDALNAVKMVKTKLFLMNKDADKAIELFRVETSSFKGVKCESLGTKAYDFLEFLLSPLLFFAC